MITRRSCYKTATSLLQEDFAKTPLLWRARNWDTVAARIHWDGSRRQSSRSLINCPKQKITAAEKQKEIEALTANVKEQASQVQKVSAQLKLTKPAPHRLADNR